MSVAIGTTIEAPFLGLRYFDEEQSHLFFGREVQVNDILDKLRRSRLVTVMGSSGSGKSSLVRAGVVPSLRAGFLGDAGPRWRVAKMRPGSSPISNLGRELEKALSVPGLEVTIRRGPLGLIQAVEECRLPVNENVLVIVDQFEELFRYQRESDHLEAAKEEAAAFVKLLLEAANQRTLPIYIVMTMRSDYLGNCALFRDLPERINDGLYLVPRMRRDQLEQAITGPVAVEDAAMTPRLVQRLLNDTGDDPDQLPVLQHAMLRAWNTWNQASRPLDLEDLDAVGGMKESLSRHADEIFDKLTADQQRVARVIFQRLCDRDAEGREIRRPAPVAHIADVACVTVEAVEDVVKPFAKPEAALLYRNEDGHLDITHESLIRKWRLIQGTTQGGGAAKGWLQEEVEARDQFQTLVERARKKDALMGRALEDALRWRALGLNGDWAKRYAPTAGADTPFEAVLAFVEECRRREVRGRRLRNGLVGVALVAVAGFLALIWRQKAVADEAAHSARVALGQASTQEAGRLVGTSRPDQALAHLARALRSDPNSLPARSWISDLLLNERLWVGGAPLLHEDAVAVFAATFSPDGRYVVTASDDKTARVWDAKTGAPVGAALQHQESVIAAAFSPNGLRVVTASSDDTARVWDVATGKPVGAPFQHSSTDAAPAFSPDGRRIATVTFGTARVWDVATGQPVGEPFSHTFGINVVAFSPDGRRVLTASDDGTARLLDTATGQPVSPILQHKDSVKAAAFSPDGRLVVTASEDHTARVWDAVTGQPALGAGPLEHTTAVGAAAFGPDGRRIVTASGDGVFVWDATATGKPVGVPLRLEGARFLAVSPDARRVVMASDDSADNKTVGVWDLDTGQPVGAPLQHGSLVRAASFSSDGRRLVTASFDKTARVWELAAGQTSVILQHQDLVVDAAFSPDSRRVVTASYDKTARVWDVVTGQPDGAPLQHQELVLSAAFSPDGRRVITVSYDNTVSVWDLATGQVIGAPLEHPHYPNRVIAAAFSSDGRRVVTASGSTARIWDATTGQIIGAPLEHPIYPERVIAAAFSSDGRHVVTASSLDKTARLWDAATGQPVKYQDGIIAAIFSGDRDRVFSPDGRRIVTVEDDDTARLRDAATGHPFGTPLQHQGGVTAATFSSDGRRVVTASSDKTARIWATATSQPVGVPLQHREAVIEATFSPDGLRVVTASDDKTARVWDTTTGQPIGAPLQHQAAPWRFLPPQEAVQMAAFSPDGRRVVTASDHTARVWQVLLDLDSDESLRLLADLAEVVGGFRVTDMGSVVPLEEPERLQRVRRLVGPGATAYVPMEVLLRRFLDGQR